MLYLPENSILSSWLQEPQSLTERLIQTGHTFDLDLTYLGQSIASKEEQDILNCSPGKEVFTRHVDLHLNGSTVIVARSSCMLEDPIWQSILQNHKQSLGLFLFANSNNIEISNLEYFMATEGHPLLISAQVHLPQLTQVYARYRKFKMEQSSLIVAEAFLDTLHQFE